MLRWALQFDEADPVRGRPAGTYEILRGEVVTVRGPRATVAWANGGWTLTRKASQRQLHEGDVIGEPPDRAQLVSFSASPLDDIEVCGPYVLFGRRRWLCPGRWPGFVLGPTGVRRVLIVGWDHESTPRRVLEGKHHVQGRVVFQEYAAADGVSLAELLEAASAGRSAGLEPALVHHLLLSAVNSAPRAGLAPEDVIITWDGEVRVLDEPQPTPTATSGSVEVLLGPVAALGQPPSRAIERIELSNLVRNLFPVEWREEAEVREQLSMLDDEGVRLLVNRSHYASEQYGEKCR